MNSTILVTGATGKVGGQVVSQLVDAGHTVRALTRDPAKAPAREGVEYVAGDLADPSSLTGALDGVERIFLVFPTLVADHAASELITTFAKQARAIVYLSSIGANDDSAQSEGIIGSHSLLERLIEDSGMEWTFLRAGGFASNTLGWASQIKAGNVLHWFAGKTARPLVHEADLAAVAVRALTETGHAGQKYELTGPTRLTQIEQAHAIGRAIGRPITFEEMSSEAAKEHLFPGMPGEVVDSILAGQASLADNPEPITTTVEDVTGAPARTFEQWALDHVDDFR